MEARRRVQGRDQLTGRSRRAASGDGAGPGEEGASHNGRAIEAAASQRAPKRGATQAARAMIAKEARDDVGGGGARAGDVQARPGRCVRRHGSRGAAYASISWRVTLLRGTGEGGEERQLAVLAASRWGKTGQGMDVRRARGGDAHARAVARRRAAKMTRSLRLALDRKSMRCAKQVRHMQRRFKRWLAQATDVCFVGKLHSSVLGRKEPGGRGFSLPVGLRGYCSEPMS